MAALHSALQALGPCKFQDIPTSPSDLAPYLQDLFQQAQLILETLPIPPADEKPESRPRSHTTTSIASNASKISSSTARSAPPIPNHAALQKEWGKPVKLSAKDNPLNMAVYRMGGKDGKGAWFARRSVQEGLGFAKFKKSLEMEFPESLAVQGAPGEGNIRGIGGDKRVEDITVPGKGRVEIFQLSAQFPGPTTPRDFVTLLITSSNAMAQDDDSARPGLSPRHYMIISKPCDHPETQPRDGFVRGNYESVEFIREVPRPSRKTRSSLDLTRLGAGKRSALEKEAVVRSAEKKKKTNTLSTNHGNKSTSDLSSAIRTNGEGSRTRGKTISFAGSRADDLCEDSDEAEGDYDPEANPVEWIMVTRSDPGGSVPRFMVERGTPGSIVADASKFLDWACQNEDVEEDPTSDSHLGLDHHRDVFPSYEANGHLAGIDDDSSKEVATSNERPSTVPSTSPSQAYASNQTGPLSNMTGALSAGLEAYAPQMALDRLSGNIPQASEAPTAGISTTLALEADNDDKDSSDSLSTTSFASADSHFDKESDHAHLSPTTSKSSSPSKDKDQGKSQAKESQAHVSQYQKELQKLDARRAALDAKLASTRSKSAKESQFQTEKERGAIRKAEEKHAKEVKKQEEKYRKEVDKIERRRKREDRKVEEKKKKDAERDERRKVERERDEARNECKRLKGEIRDEWMRQVGQLQQETTGLVAKVGRLEREIEELKAGRDVVVGEDDEGDDQRKGIKEKILQPIIMDRDAVKKLLKKEDKGAAGLGARLRGVSMGSASPSASSVESVGSKRSSLLKRGNTMGTGVDSEHGDLGGSPQQHDTGSSS